MFTHYLKIAFRNLWKYKTQNLIGIIGLSLGFLCFSVCSYSVKYFAEYDSHYKNADRIYEVKPRYRSVAKCNIGMVLHDFGEVEKTTSTVRPEYGYVSVQDNQEAMFRTFIAEADTSFVDFFSIEVSIGNKHIMFNTENSLALYESQARKMGISGEHIGVTMLIDTVTYQLTGILKDPPSNSTPGTLQGFIFNKAGGYYQQEQYEWNPRKQWWTCVLLREGVTQEAFQKRLDAQGFQFESDNPDFKDHVEVSRLIEMDT